MPLQRHERLSRQIADLDADVDMEQFRSESATPAHFDGLPAAATQAIVLAIQDSIQPQDDLGVAAPLITPSPQQDDGSHLKKRAVVVTVTQTQELSGGNAGGSSNSSTQTVPLGIIIGSVAVGVVIAIAVVGGWLWLSKRKRQNQKRHLRPPPRSYPTGSNRPLIPGEKGYVASPAKARTADYSYQSKTAAAPVKSLAFPSEAKSNEPRSVPVAAATASSTSALAATTTSPTKKSFAPVKSSPLSGGKKAEPSNRGNEWAKPISPPTTTDGHTGGYNLGVPGGADGDRRVSVASAESHYDDDDGYNHNR